MFPRIAAYLWFFLVNNIVKSVLKGSETSLFIDDLALCIYAKSHQVFDRIFFT